MPWVPIAASPLARRRKQRLQGLVDLRIARDEPSAGHEKRIAGGENDMAGGVGVDDTSGCIDQADPGAEAVERIGEGRGLRGLEIDQPADQYRAADVRNDQRMRRRASSSTTPSRSLRNTPNSAAEVTDLSSTAETKSTRPCGWAHSL